MVPYTIILLEMTGTLSHSRTQTRHCLRAQVEMGPVLPGVVDPAMAASMLSAGFGAEQPGRLDDQGARDCTQASGPTQYLIAIWVPRPISLVSPKPDPEFTSKP